jgi:uncharacterized protein YciI
MKKTMLVCATVVVGASAFGQSDGPRPESIAKDGFSRLKSLVGAWAGPDTDGDGAPDYTVVYRLSSGGNAVIATQFPGMPMEMTNMFHLDGEDLVMTHYCAIGNQPHLRLVDDGPTDGADDDEEKRPESLHFTFVSGTNMASRRDRHMGELVMTFSDENTVLEEWTEFVDAKPVNTFGFESTRVIEEGEAHDDGAEKKELGADDFERLFFVMLGAGPNRTDEITDEVVERQAAHRRHLDEMKEAGQLVLAGPFENGGGLLILRVDSMEAARALMDVDPHVRAGWLSADIKPWYTLKGKL